ncbi:MAG: hypothetical protein R6V47_04440, partial [Candidatus Delongbacteria bacterium]
HLILQFKAVGGNCFLTWDDGGVVDEDVKAIRKILLNLYSKCLYGIKTGKIRLIDLEGILFY